MSQYKLINIPVDLFQNQQLIPNDSSTKFFLNISSYFNETVINVQQLIGDFNRRLYGNNLAFKDANNYPIHILRIDNQKKFIIIPAYDETFMKVWSPVMATAIVILVVLYFEISACIKSCLKRGWAKEAAVFPQGTSTESSQLPTANDVNGQLKAIENAMDEIWFQLRSIAHTRPRPKIDSFDQPCDPYQVQLNPQAIPDKASYVPPI